MMDTIQRRDDEQTPIFYEVLDELAERFRYTEGQWEPGGAPDAPIESDDDPSPLASETQDLLSPTPPSAEAERLDPLEYDVWTLPAAECTLPIRRLPDAASPEGVL